VGSGVTLLHVQAAVEGRGRGPRRRPRRAGGQCGRGAGPTEEGGAADLRERARAAEGRAARHGRGAGGRRESFSRRFSFARFVGLSRFLQHTLSGAPYFPHKIAQNAPRPKKNLQRWPIYSFCWRSKFYLPRSKPAVIIAWTRDSGRCSK
jgi:hypothetical protein